MPPMSRPRMNTAIAARRVPASRLMFMFPAWTESVAEHLHDDLPVDLRDAFEHVVANWLRHRRIEPRHLVHGVFDLRREIFAADLSRPLGRRLEIDEELRHVDRLRIRSVLRSARL